MKNKRKEFKTIWKAMSFMLFALIIGACTSSDDSKDDPSGPTQDTTAPIAGANGVMTANATVNTITLQWTKAKDETTSEASLQYKLYYSQTENDVTDVENIDNANSAGDFQAGMTEKQVTGLAEYNTYYFNVVVKDEAGNEALYSAKQTRTLDGTAPTVSDMNLVVTGDPSTDLSVSWTNVTDASDITYQVYWSKDPSIDTVDNILANGGEIASTVSGTSTQLSDVEAEIIYINVIANDIDNNKAAFAMEMVDNRNGLSGKVVDGYVRNALVCVDLNFNDECDDGEPYTKTDASGDYHDLKIAPSLFMDIEVPVVILQGGVDISTGKLFTSLLKAPILKTNQGIGGSGGTIQVNLTPLTGILAQKLLDQAEAAGTGFEMTETFFNDAKTDVANTLGIPAGIDLLDDPVKKASESEDGKTMLKKAIQVQKIVEVVCAAERKVDTSGDSVDTMKRKKASDILSAIADQTEGSSKSMSEIITGLADATEDVEKISTIANTLSTAVEKIETVFDNESGSLNTEKINLLSSVAEKVTEVLEEQIDQDWVEDPTIFDGSFDELDVSTDLNSYDVSDADFLSQMEIERLLTMINLDKDDSVTDASYDYLVGLLAGHGSITGETGLDDLYTIIIDQPEDATFDSQFKWHVIGAIEDFQIEFADLLPPDSTVSLTIGPGEKEFFTFVSPISRRYEFKFFDFSDSSDDLNVYIFSDFSKEDLGETSQISLNNTSEGGILSYASTWEMEGDYWIKLENTSSSDKTFKIQAVKDLGAVVNVTVQNIAHIGTFFDDMGPIAADSVGNYYAAIHTGGGFDGNLNKGKTDVFVFKFDSNGEKLWSDQIATVEKDEASAIGIDNAGNVYFCGITEGSMPGHTNMGDLDYFIAKYSSTGDQQWILQDGTDQSDSADEDTAMCRVDGEGNVFFMSSTLGSMHGQPNLGAEDIFLVKYDTDKNRLWTSQFGDAAFNSGWDLILDTNGNSYIAARTEVAPEDTDFQLMKVDSTGSQVWNRTLGTIEKDDVEQTLTIDSDGNLYAALHTWGDFQGLTNLGMADSYIVKYDADGQLIWTRQFGTNLSDQILGATIINDGLYVTGISDSDLPGLPNQGGYDAVIAKYDLNGNVVWMRSVASPSHDFGWSPVGDADQNLVSVVFSMGDIDSKENKGAIDAYVVKFDSNGNRLAINESSYTGGNNSGYTMLAESLSLYDDFNSGGLSTSQWSTPIGVGFEVLDGELILERSLPEGAVYSDSFSSATMAMIPTSRMGVGADFKSIEATGAISKFEGGLRRVWFYTDTTGNPIFAEMGHYGFNTVGWVAKCIGTIDPNGGNCEGEEIQLASTQLAGEIDFSQFRTFSIQWDGNTSFTFGLDQTTDTLDVGAMAPFGSAGATGASGLEIMLEVGFNGEGSVKAAVDNIVYDTTGAGDWVTFDNFDSPELDADKWKFVESRRVKDNKFESGQVNGAWGLQTSPNNSISALAMDVTLESQSGNGMFTLLRGAYNDASGTVMGLINITSSGVVATVERWPTDDYSFEGEILSKKYLGPSAIGNTHTIYLEWSGTEFIFQLDDRAPYTVNPVALGATFVEMAQSDDFVIVTGNHLISFNDTQYFYQKGSSFATIDNVRYAGSVTEPSKSIIGSWIPERDKDDDLHYEWVLTFFEDGTYLHTTTHSGSDPCVHTEGAEYGTYTYNADNQTLTTNLTFDDNGCYGMSPGDGQTENIIINGDQMNYGFGTLALNRVVEADNPIIGSWIPDDGNVNYAWVLSFFDDGRYFHFTYSSGSDPCPHSAGFEYGTYDLSGDMLTTTYSANDNGCFGLSNNDTIPTLLSITDDFFNYDNGLLELKRVVE